jgi:hypothetical protein
MDKKLKEFWEWVQRTFTPTYKSEIEDYLSQSVDRIDLENRMNLLMRRGQI